MLKFFIRKVLKIKSNEDTAHTKASLEQQSTTKHTHARTNKHTHTQTKNRQRLNIVYDISLLLLQYWNYGHYN